jgi:hypothetical protein
MMSIRVDENAFGETLLLDGAAGAVASELAAVFTATVRIGDSLLAASIAVTPNVYENPLRRFLALKDVTASVVEMRESDPPDGPR